VPVGWLLDLCEAAKEAQRPAKTRHGSHGIVALQRVFAACGKLRPMILEPAGLQGAHQSHSINLSRLYDVFVAYLKVRCP
jgi:hypothetical protein